MNRPNPLNKATDGPKAYVPSLPKYVQQNPVYQKFNMAHNAAQNQYHHESQDNSGEEHHDHDDDEDDYEEKQHHGSPQDEEEDQEHDNYEHGEDQQEEEEDENQEEEEELGDEEEENPYQEEEPIMEEEGESDPEESARNHRKGYKPSPKLKQQSNQVDYVAQKPSPPKQQALQIEEVVDLKKIKNSKLYQKFLKETNKPSSEASSVNTSKVTDYETNKGSSNYTTNKEQSNYGSGKKPVQKYQEPPREDDDVPYYKKKVQKQPSLEQDPPPLKPSKSALVVEEKKPNSPIKKSNTQDERYNSNKVPVYERGSSDPNNLSNPEIVAGKFQNCYNP